MLIYVLQSIRAAKNEIIILISVQYKQAGGSSFGTTDDCDSEAGGDVEGHFACQKKTV